MATQITIPLSDIAQTYLNSDNKQVIEELKARKIRIFREVESARNEEEAKILNYISYYLIKKAEEYKLDYKLIDQKISLTDALILQITAEIIYHAIRDNTPLLKNLCFTYENDTFKFALEGFEDLQISWV